MRDINPNPLTKAADLIRQEVRRLELHLTEDPKEHPDGIIRFGHEASIMVFEIIKDIKILEKYNDAWHKYVFGNK